MNFWDLFTCKGTYMIDWVGRVESQFSLKTDSWYPRDVGVFSINDGNPWEFPPLWHPLVSSTCLHPRPFRGAGRATSGGALAPQLPRATRSQPELIRFFPNSFFAPPKTRLPPIFPLSAFSAVTQSDLRAVAAAAGRRERGLNRNRGPGQNAVKLWQFFAETTFFFFRIKPAESEISKGEKRGRCPCHQSHVTPFFHRLS